jgi:hypothetical protein
MGDEEASEWIVHGKALQCWAAILLRLVAGTTVTVRQFVVAFQLGRERAKLSICSLCEDAK